jgi:hypothetical protein
MGQFAAEYCEACGANCLLRDHRCDPRKLRAIDAAMERDPDDEEPRRKPFNQRLRDGFEILNENLMAAGDHDGQCGSNF